MKVRKRKCGRMCSNIRPAIRPKNETVDISGGKSEGVKYPGALVLLETTKIEYEYENTRKASLETRAGVLMAFSSTLFALTITSLKTPEFSMILTVDEVLYSLFLALVIFAVWRQSEVFYTKEYKRINCESFDQEYAAHPEENVAISIINGYVQCLKIARENNEKKSELMNQSIISMLGSVALILMYYYISVGQI